MFSPKQPVTNHKDTSIWKTSWKKVFVIKFQNFQMYFIHSAFVLHVCFYSIHVKANTKKSLNFFPLLLIKISGFPGTELQFITLYLRGIRLWLITAHFALVIQEPITMKVWGSNVPSAIKTVKMQHISMLSKLFSLVMPLFKICDNKLAKYNSNNKKY
jgi:hypothetical protein